MPESGYQPDFGPSTPADGGTVSPWPANRSNLIEVPDGYAVPIRTPYNEPGTVAGGSPMGPYTPLPPGVEQGSDGNYYRYSTRLPAYHDGADVRAGIGKSEQWILATQRQLEAAGLLSSDYIPGFWDQATQGAMAELMGYANQRGMTWQNTLAMITEQGGVGGNGGGGPALPPIQHAPEWALDQLLEDAGTQYLGRNFTDQEKQQFIAAYREMENGSREQAMEADSTIARAFAQRSDPVAYAANKAVDVYDTILQTLTGGAV